MDARRGRHRRLTPKKCVAGPFYKVCDTFTETLNTERETMIDPDNPPTGVDPYPLLCAEILAAIPWGWVSPTSELHELDKKYQKMRGFTDTEESVKLLEDLFLTIEGPDWSRDYSICGKRYIWNTPKPGVDRLVYVHEKGLWMGTRTELKNGQTQHRKIFECPHQQRMQFVEVLRSTWFTTGSAQKGKGNQGSAYKPKKKKFWIF